MKIAQIAPLIESVPPQLYGGTERIVSYLTEELIVQGHEVTLFASGDSKTPARLVPCCERALRLDPAVRDPIPYHMLLVDKVRRMAKAFDVLHFHIDRAIAIARAVGLPLRIAAKVDRVDEAYFEREIKPLLDQPGVSFVGEIGEREKGKFLGEARALLFPIDWPEPFGLVMIEAMACGTPVLAFRHGSVPEVIDNGVTGFVVDTMQEAICRIGALLALDRGRIRRQFERRFTARRMAQDYLRVYQTIRTIPARRAADGKVVGLGPHKPAPSAPPPRPVEVAAHR